MIDLKSDETKWTILAMLLTMAAVKGSHFFIEKSWRKVRYQEPPLQPELPEVDWKEALLWAMITGLITGLVRMLARRGSARVWKRITGRSLPSA